MHWEEDVRNSKRNTGRGDCPSNSLSRGKMERMVTVKTLGDDMVMGSKTK